jgi:hypothetical protein
MAAKELTERFPAAPIALATRKSFEKSLLVPELLRKWRAAAPRAAASHFQNRVTCGDLEQRRIGLTRIDRGYASARRDRWEAIVTNFG